MAIVDANTGKPLNIDNMDGIGDDVVIPEGTPEPATQTLDPVTGLPVVDKTPEQVAEEAEAAAAAEAASKKPATTFDPPTDDLITPPEPPELDAEGNPIDESIEDQGEPDPDADLYSGLSDILKSRGIFGEEAEVKGETDFFEAFNKAVTAKVDERHAEVEKYMNTGIPYEEIAQIQKAITDVSSITEADLAGNEELSKNLIVSEFKNKGFSEEDSEGYYEAFKSANIVEAEALKAKVARENGLKGLLNKKITDAENYKVTQAQEREKNSKKLVESLKEGTIMGRTVTPVTATKLESVLNTVVGHTKTGEPLNAYMKFKEENPVEFERNLLYLFTVTEGFKNFKAFDRSAQTRVSSKLRTAVSTINSGKSFIDTPSTTGKHTIDMNTIDDIV